ncbi:hypothetical protein MAPG_12083 [Magnaporthiopsis poae ATCC 64411]|uniref:Uncharacterized protein n=1 Tax=Magnaporthiopsis poae (strain ATCC 64411 / 73-15) TaxID=644358 RepID=A0A0C4EGT2_MAGP6|nr:hypothetical protein MAPG_12083 [Magnaporthiopsis poae ATCC 64411]
MHTIYTCPTNPYRTDKNASMTNGNPAASPKSAARQLLHFTADFVFGRNCSGVPFIVCHRVPEAMLAEARYKAVVALGPIGMMYEREGGFATDWPGAWADPERFQRWLQGWLEFEPVPSLAQGGPTFASRHGAAPQADAGRPPPPYIHAHAPPPTPVGPTITP